MSRVLARMCDTGGERGMSLADLPHLERALHLAELCELAYAPSPARIAHEARLTFEMEPFRYHVSLGGVPLGLSGFLACSGEDVVLVFCGSRAATEQIALANWTINLAVSQVDGFGGRLHRGFANALGEIWEDVSTRVQTRCADGALRLWITGHSLGGALATLTACRLAEAQPPQSIAMIYTFGSPRVGDRAFADRYRFRHFRFENRNDVVAYLCPPPDNLPGWFKGLARWAVQQVFKTDVPESVFNYRHVGKCQFLHWDGTLKDAQDPFSLERLNRLTDAISDHRVSSYVAALRRLQS